MLRVRVVHVLPLWLQRPTQISAIHCCAEVLHRQAVALSTTMHTRPMRLQDAEHRRGRTPLGAGVGVCAGCFLGSGYGYAVGLGRVTGTRFGGVVVPSMEPFAHQGALAGAFCGVSFGAGMGTMLAQGLVFHTRWRVPEPEHDAPWLLIPEAWRTAPRRAIAALDETMAVIAARVPPPVLKAAKRIWRFRISR